VVYRLLHLADFRLVGLVAVANPVQVGRSLTALVQVIRYLKVSQLNSVISAPVEDFDQLTQLYLAAGSKNLL